MARPAARYQNALSQYGPGRNAGFYPDAGWQGNGGPASPPYVPPQQFAPAPYVPMPQEYPVTPYSTQAPPSAPDPIAGALGNLAPDLLKKGFEYLARPDVPNVGIGPAPVGAVVQSALPDIGFSPAPVGTVVQTPLPDIGFSPAPVGDVVQSALPDIASGAAGDAASATAGAEASAGFFSGGWTGGINIDPIEIGASMLGTWGGNRLGADLVDGDADQQGLWGSVGGAAGGFVGGKLMGGGPLGTMIGSFVGSLAGSTLGAGSPDYPTAWDTATVGRDGLILSVPGAENGANPNSISGLSNSLAGYIQDRAASDGLQFDPFHANEGYNVGFHNKEMTYQHAGLGGANPSSNEFQWSGRNQDELQEFAYRNLQDRGILTAAPRITWDQYAGDQNALAQRYQDRLFNPGAWDIGTVNGAEDSWSAPVAPDAPNGMYSGRNDQYWGQFLPGLAGLDANGDGGSGDGGGDGGDGGSGDL